MASSVTIDKAYFATLLRSHTRAQHQNGTEFTSTSNFETVTIPKVEYDSLWNSRRQLTNLQRNLHDGGLAEEMLVTLMKDGADPADYSGGEGFVTNTPQSPSTSPIAQHPQGARDYSYDGFPDDNVRIGNTRYQDENPQNLLPYAEDFASPTGEGPDFFHGRNGNHNGNNHLHQQYDKFAKRTLLLCNLAEGVTYADIVDSVRGGMLLDITFRGHNRNASVSFLEESQAQEFFRHVKRHDLYIGGKRVEIRWSDRQFILPGHVASKIGIGATRNLIVRNRKPKHTEEAIRDDLEHIHDLVIIKISYPGQDIHISTNSVHNAMFARTCMMSRATYKGHKVLWGDDECADPLPAPRNLTKQKMPIKEEKFVVPMNRFQALSISETGSISGAL